MSSDALQSAASRLQAELGDWQELSREALVDRLLGAQQQDREAGQPRGLDVYALAFPELFESTSSAVDLIYNEFLLRVQQGEATDNLKREYLGSFPEHEQELERQFEVYNAILIDPMATRGTHPFEMFEAQRELLQQTFQTSRFRLKDVIGEGTFATVYRAWDHVLRRWVAVKFAKQRFDGPSIEQERFTREAEAAAGLTHPGVVSVYEFGQSDGRAFIVQELVAGGTLKQRIDDGNYSIRDAVSWVSQLCDAIDYAHRYGIVHRDLKPANILFDDRNQPKVADFGLAALMDEESRLTRHGDLIGTPAYMSPEQAAGEAVTESSDVYSLGVVMYELLAGRPPFVGPVATVIEQVANQEPKFEKTETPVPIDLQAICLKALTKQASDRYASASEFSMDLQRFLLGESVLAKRRGRWERSIRWFARRPALSGTIVIALVLLFAIGLYSIFKIQKERQKFLNQRDVANARLFESLLSNAEFSLKSRQDEWYSNTLDYLDKGASLATTPEQLQSMQEILVEVLSDDMPRLELVERWQGPSKPVSALAATERWIVTAYEDGQVLVSNREGQPAFHLDGASGAVTKVDCPDEQNVFALANGQVYHWRIESDSTAAPVRLPPVYQCAGTSFCVLGHQNSSLELVVGNSSQSLNVIDIQTHRISRTLNTDRSQPPSLLVSSRESSSLMAAYSDFQVVVMDGNSGDSLLRHRAEDRVKAMLLKDAGNLTFTTGVGYRTDGYHQGSLCVSQGLGSAPLTLAPIELHGVEYTLVGTDDGSLVLLDSMQHSVARRRLQKGLTKICFDPASKNQVIASNELGEVMCFRATRNRSSYRFPTVNSLSFAPDGSLFCEGRIYRPFAEDEMRESAGIHFSAVNAIDTSPEGFVAAALNEGSVEVIGPTQEKRSLAFDGNAIQKVSIGNRSRTVWVAQTDMLTCQSLLPSDTKPVRLKMRGPIQCLAADHRSQTCFAATNEHIFRIDAAKLGDSDAPTPPKVRTWLELNTDEPAIIRLTSGMLIVARGNQLSLYSAEVRDRLIHQVTTDVPIVDVACLESGSALFVLTDRSCQKFTIEHHEGKRSLRNDVSAPIKGGVSLALDPQLRWLAWKAGKQSPQVRILDTATLKTEKVMFPRITMNSIQCWFGNGDYGLGDRGLVRIPRKKLENAEPTKANSIAEVPFDYSFQWEVPGDPWAARWDVDTSPDGRWYAVGRHYASVAILDRESRKLNRILGGFPGEVWNVEFSPDSRWLAVGSESRDDDQSTAGVLQLWDTQTWTMKYSRRIGKRLVAGLAFHPTQPLLAVSSFDGGLKLIQVDSGKVIKTLLPSQTGTRQRSLATMDVAFSDDGQFLAVSRKTKGIVVWPVNVKRGLPLDKQLIVGEVISVDLPGKQTWALAFDRTGKRLAVASELGEVDLFRVGSFQHLLTMRSGLKRLRKLEFSPDNKILAASAFTASGIAWNLRELQQAMQQLQSKCEPEVARPKLFLEVSRQD